MPSPSLRRRIACELTAAEAGQTLVTFLSGRFTYRNASGWRAECEAGRLLLNGRTASPDDRLTAGGHLEYLPQPLAEPPVDFAVSLLWRGEDCAVLAKPANLPCHPAGRFFNHTLWALLRCGLVSGLPAQESIHFASRLDRETSGLVLVGWTPAAARRLPAPAWRCPDDRPEKKRGPAGLCAPLFQYTEGRAARAAPPGPHPVLPCGKKRFAGARRRAASAGCGRMCGACKGRRDCNPSADSRERRGA